MQPKYVHCYFTPACMVGVHSVPATGCNEYSDNIKPDEREKDKFDEVETFTFDEFKDRFPKGAGLEEVQKKSWTPGSQEFYQ